MGVVWLGGVLHAHQTGLAHEVGALAVGLDDEVAAVGILRVVDVVEQLAVADLATDGIDAQLDDIVLQVMVSPAFAGWLASLPGTAALASLLPLAGAEGMLASAPAAWLPLPCWAWVCCWAVWAGFWPNRVGWPCCSCQLFHNMTRQMERMTQRTVLWDCCIVGGIWSVSGDAEEYPSLTPDVGPKAL